MIIGINGSFLRKIDSGTGQVTINFLRQLAKKELAKDQRERRRIILYLEEDFSLRKLGLKDAEEEKFFEKKVFLPKYRRDDLVRKIWWEKFLLPKEVEKDGCQIFFSLYQSTTIFKNQKIRHLMLVHDVIWKIFPQYLNNLRKKIYYFLVEAAIYKADKILTVSLSSKEDLKKFFQLPEEKIAVTAIDCDEIFKKPTGNSEESEKILKHHKITDPGYIFYVGGFDQRKNVGFLVEAYGWLWKNHRRFLEKKGENFPDLVLAGKFNQHLVPVVENLPEKINQMTKKFSLPKEKIKMIGFAKQKDLPSLYSLAGLFVFPSLYEGFGLPPLEAYNCACPALTNRNSSLKEVTGQDDELSLLMEDPEKIAQRMAEIFLDKEKRKRMIEKEKRRCRMFSWEKFVSSVEKEWFSLK